MYIILTAMLAVNVSSDVIDGFRHVSDGLDQSNKSVSSRNEAQYAILEEIYIDNPQKADRSHAQGNLLKALSDSITLSVEQLKLSIAVLADGEDANPSNLKNAENLDAATSVMLDPIAGKGKKLMKDIRDYADFVSVIVTDSIKQSAVRKLLLDNATDWEQRFENMPAVAAITMLSKIQNDVRQAESEALAGIINSIDSNDLRVNSINPYIIPESGIVMRGGEYAADVVMAALDTTSRPLFYLNGKPLQDGKIRIPATSPGEHTFEGYSETRLPDGSVSRIPFKGAFEVIEPMATVSASMMNVLYAGIDNPVSISAPGIPMTAISASMTNGSLSRSGNHWIARPDKIGAESQITVTARLDGRSTTVGTTTFRVRKLPDPSPFIAITDGRGDESHYKGSPRKLSKGALLQASGLGAAIDDDLLNVSFSVISFSTIFLDQMGNAIPEVSDGAAFSQRQKEQFRRLKPGKRFFITNVKAKGPDGVVRDISPMEVVLN